MLENTSIVGRYAPSPTGELHLGNLRTAVLAWLHARLQGGTFLLRMEDIDLPRVVSGSADQILRDLEWLGLDWDGEVIYQSQRLEYYQTALAELDRQGVIYPCFCSRKDIRKAGSAPHREVNETPSKIIYPGTCRQLSLAQRKDKRKHKHPALRLRVDDDLEEQCGDFVVKRADDLFAYQLVVVVDDLAQGVNQVVRGADLADSTARQQYLATLLSRQNASKSSSIAYFHTPLMCDENGQRMSKRDGSLSISAWRDQGNSQPERLLATLLQSLGLDLGAAFETSLYSSLDINGGLQISSDDALELISVADVERCFV